VPADGTAEVDIVDNGLVRLAYGRGVVYVREAASRAAATR
jgi:hypothetical protein